MTFWFISMDNLMVNSYKIKLAKRYSDLLKNVLDDNLISTFLYGSVVRNEDNESSDIDLMAIVNKSPAAEQLKILGESGRFNEIKGFGDFKDISCAILTQDNFLNLLELGAPREAVNPLREAVVLLDTGFIEGLKKQLEDGYISLRKDAYRDYLRYGDIRRSYLMRSIENEDLEAARSDAAAAASHYLRAYFLCEAGEMIVSKRALVEGIHEGCPGIARVYDGVFGGELDVDVVLDSLDEIREWVTEHIFALKNRG
ncbi:MAG: nucleotidyltransferase domain-containing protein [Methanosarcinales archaeon]|nr:nucleotidyltransferase domain-containing protein [Methanosarcinales archaeon]